jgi:hypothetical protein
VLNQSAYNAYQMMNEYMIRSHNVRVYGDNKAADEDWKEAVKYEKIMNSALSELAAKRKPKSDE